MSKTILTGLRVNSSLHLGNYLGAILPMTKQVNQISDEDKFFMFVPDLHSFTTPIDHSVLIPNTYYNIKVYLAAGINYERDNIHLYRQSRIPAHSELAWILSCFTPFGLASKMTQFKDKSRNKGESVSVGLFTYPILMAADILLYNADYVPLGDDQKQHLELARDLAIKFNNKFGETFKPPKAWKEQLGFMKLTEGIRIRSLQNPESKMSKSVTDPRGTILLTDEPTAAAKKIMSAVTDTVEEINFNWETQPGISNLLQIHSLLSGQDLTQVKQDWTGQTRYGDLKKTVANEVEQFLSNLQTSISKIEDSKVEKILTQGESEVSPTAKKTLHKAQIKAGLRTE